MLTYEDCSGFCGLAAKEIATIARHEHLPEILALELGAQPCSTSNGKEVIRRMILDDIEEGHERGDLMAAVRLGLVPQRFAETHLDLPSPVELDRLGCRCASSYRASPALPADVWPA